MGNLKRPTLPWRRYWVRFGEAIDCGEERGFLTDPEDRYGRHANPNVARLDSLLPRVGPTVLCGEPGIGKSTELEGVRAVLAPEGEFLRWIVFRDVADVTDFRRRTVDHTLWKEWRVGSGRMNLVVDGVDEGLLRVPNFINDLRGMLADEPVDRLRLVLGCRTAEWPIEMGRRLFDLWPDHASQPICELCPLRRQDAELAAQAAGCDVEKFLEAVWERRVTALAARPVTLFFLVDEFRRHGHFPATHRELYERGTANLSREIDPARLELLRSIRKTTLPITDAERLRAAQHLAALLLLSGRSAIQLPGAAFGIENAGDLLLEEGSGGAANPTMPALEEAVESALFTSAGGERRFGFVHQTFAECLAAQRLASLPLIQLRQLLCQRDPRGEHVVPQLSELAAWLAGNHREFCEHILRIEPEVLLRSDVARLNDDVKMRLVAAVLKGAAEDKISDDVGYRRFLSGLNHPDLAAQLRPIIENTAGHLIARRMAMHIAEECKCVDVADALVAVVMNPAESNHIRDEAAGALADAAPADGLAILEPLAKGEVLPDPDDTIKGAALRRFVPQHWSVRAALPYVTPRKNSHFMGMYEMFLRYELPKAITVDDLPDVLAWLRDKPNALDSLSPFHKVASAAAAKALSHLDLPVVREATADLWQVWLLRHDIHHLPTDSELRTVLLENADARHQLASMFLNHAATEPKHATRLRWPLPVIHGSESLDWLLDNITGAPADRQANWAAAIAVLANDPAVVAPCLDKLLLRMADVPALTAQFEWLRAWDREEKIARNAKAAWLREKRLRKQAAKYAYVAPDPKPQIDGAFAQFSTGNQLAWLQLWYQLILGENGHEEHVLNPDVMSCPNWQRLTSEQRNLIPSVARAFLLTQKPEQNPYNTITGPSLAAISAIWLLRDTLASDDELRAVLSTKWLPTVVSYVEDSAPRHELFALVFELSPDAAITELMHKAAEEAKQHKHPFAFRLARKCWSVALSTAAIKLVDGWTNPEAVLNGLTEVAERDPEAVADYISGLIHNVQPAIAYPIQLFGALAVGLSFMPERFWPAVEPLLEADTDLARKVLAHVCYGLDLDRRGTLARMSEAQLERLFLLLRRVYPPADDPPARKGGFVSGNDCARRLRGQLPGMIAGRGTEAACSELGKLATAFPEEATWFRWSQREAIANVRRDKWKPPPPNDVKSVIERADARILNSDDDLVDVILESLARLQRALTRQSLPKAEELWAWDGAGLKRSKFRPKDEEALSDYVARWLSEDLGPAAGVIVNREVQPRRGARTDIIVDAVTRKPEADYNKLTVVIEVKGCWHSDVRTGLETQLVDGYLKAHGWRCGIYLVGWFVCPQWQKPVNRLRSVTAADAANEVEALSVGFDGVSSPYLVRTCLLDCTLPPAKAPSS